LAHRSQPLEEIEHFDSLGINLEDPQRLPFRQWRVLRVLVGFEDC
jgi:hypothetical protein